MKILITGANGQLGRELTAQYGNRSVELILTDVADLDITDGKSVYEFVKACRPEVIINCAAHTAVDKCESDVDNAYRINAIGPKNLAQAAYRIGAEIVQISTDYVFDGFVDKKLTEFDSPNPQTVYGASKLHGENFVKQLNPKHYIIRTAWLYGDGNNFVRTMVNLGKNNASLKVVNDQHGTPTSTVDLSRAIIKLIDEKNYGLFHGTCKGQCTWYDFAKEIFRLSSMNVQVEPCSTEEFPRPAKRPQYSVLRNYMMELTMGDVFRDWEEELHSYMSSII
jgi:dTDP-4-dehydrorhamnose reductase